MQVGYFPGWLSTKQWIYHFARFLTWQDLYVRQLWNPLPPAMRIRKKAHGRTHRKGFMERRGKGLDMSPCSLCRCHHRPHLEAFLCDQEENKMDLWKVTFCLPQWSPIFIAQEYSRHVEFWVPLKDCAIWMVMVTKKDGQCWLRSLQLTFQCWSACAPGCLCMWIHNHRDQV